MNLSPSGEPLDSPQHRYGLVLHPCRAADASAASPPLLSTLALLTGLSPSALASWALRGPSAALLSALRRSHAHSALFRFARSLRAASAGPQSPLERQRELCALLPLSPAFPLHPDSRCVPLQAACFVREGVLTFLDCRLLSARSQRCLRLLPARLPALLATPLVTRVLATPQAPYCRDAGAAMARGDAARPRPELCAVAPGLTRCELVDFRTRVADSGKMAVLDDLLKELKAEGHRVLIYSQVGAIFLFRFSRQFRAPCPRVLLSNFWEVVCVFLFPKHFLGVARNYL